MERKYCSQNNINESVYKFKKSKELSQKIKLQLLFEASELNAIELEIWLRKNGLKKEHLKIWKDELIEMANDNKKNKTLSELLGITIYQIEI